MEINFQNISLNVEITRNNDSDNYILFLHGFSGSSKDWLEILPGINKDYNFIMPDFAGHGKSDSPEVPDFYQTGSIVQQIKIISETITPEKIILLG